MEFFTRPLFDLAQGFLGRRNAVDDVLPLRRQEQVAFLGLAKLLEGEHVDRPEIIEPLPQIVGLATGSLRGQMPHPVRSFRPARQATIFNSCWQFSARVLELCDGLGLADLDLGPFVPGLGRPAVEFGQFVAHRVGHLAGSRQGRDRRGQLDIFAVAISSPADAIRSVISFIEGCRSLIFASASVISRF